MTRFFFLGSLLLWVVSTAHAFAPATTGSSFVQTRALKTTAQGFGKPTFARPTTTLHMNLFDRFSRVAKANLNNVLKNLEDPEKILNQALEDMQVR